MDEDHPALDVINRGACQASVNLDSTGQVAEQGPNVGAAIELWKRHYRFFFGF